MLTRDDMYQIEILFNNASTDQMKAIAHMFNFAQQRNAQSAARSFKVGQSVKWNGKRGDMSGKVVKVLRKNIRVKTEADGVWNVAASMLQAA